MAMSPRTSLMTAAQVLNWRHKLSLRQTEAADLLGLSLRHYINLEHGDSPTYKSLVLAMWLIDEISLDHPTYIELKNLLADYIGEMQGKEL